MAEQRNLARLAVPLSAVVVAVCAVAVTIKVFAGGLPLQQQRVLDPTALAQQVADQAQLGGQGTGLKADCPVSVTVVPGAKFECDLLKNGSSVGHSTVTILNDQGELSVSAA
jgi:hypothetical protein